MAQLPSQCFRDIIKAPNNVNLDFEEIVWLDPPPFL